jgi:hypothetical protein
MLDRLSPAAEETARETDAWIEAFAAALRRGHARALDSAADQRDRKGKLAKQIETRS